MSTYNLDKISQISSSSALDHLSSVNDYYGYTVKLSFNVPARYIAAGLGLGGVAGGTMFLKHKTRPLVMTTTPWGTSTTGAPNMTGDFSSLSKPGVNEGYNFNEGVDSNGVPRTTGQPPRRQNTD